MKKWLIFVLGALTGIVLTFLVAFIFTLGKSNNNDVTWFDEPGEVVNQRSFEVFQVLEDHAALVHGKSDYGNLYLGAVYLLTNDDGKYYYDDEIVKVPSDMVVRQVGIYQYQTKSDFGKTVPIIEIMEK